MAAAGGAPATAYASAAMHPALAVQSRQSQSMGRLQQQEGEFSSSINIPFSFEITHFAVEKKFETLGRQRPNFLFDFKRC